KAFEYADYQKIASYFTYPLTFSLLDNPQIISNKKDLIAFYKKMRTNVQDGYKYSLLDKSRIVWLSKDVYMIDATYSRYNDEYKRIFQGRGVYMYKKTDNKWKMFSVSSLPIAKKKVKKPKQ
ncbi:nuclear transport factor 2 family protein, partial [Flavobacteriaceae bacterium]|nr:nuclear transport factor 2 family protein [Flavobacteriaceae bacterium]